MLETGWRTVLPGRGRATRQSPRNCQWGQVGGGGSQRGYQATRLQKLRRAHVRTHRERKASVLRLGFHPYGAVVERGLGTSGICSLCLFDYRVRNQSRRHGRDQNEIERLGARTL